MLVAATLQSSFGAVPTDKKKKELRLSRTQDKKTEKNGTDNNTDKRNTDRCCFCLP